MQFTRRKRLGRGTKIVIGVSGLFVGVVAALAAAVLIFVTTVSNTFTAGREVIDDAFPPASSRPAPAADGSRNILLLGSDARGSVAGIGDEGSTGQRTDTIMVVHVPADRKDVQVMSIMRDSWVDVPGHGEAKINAAFSWGGTPLMVQTVEALLGTRIDHVALIGFDGFKDMTDALGGVTVHSEQAFTMEGHHFTEGANHLDGDAALAFVRARYPFADGDYQRVRNQQAFMKAVATTAISQRTLTSPERILAFTDATARHLAVDPGLDFQTLLGLGLSLRDVRAGDIGFFTVPTAGTGMVGDQSVVFVDEERLAALRVALAEDGVTEFAASLR
jgi:LCP family protein required for cell wall assembly